MKLKTISRFTIALSLSLGLLIIMLSGCSNDSPMESIPASSITSNADVAESVATAVGEESGGVIDQAGDIVELSKGLRFGNATGDGFLDHREATYDESTGVWTLVVQRERGVQGEVPFGYWDRIFTYQFLNVDGQPQKNFITDSDTARTINYEIVEGDGYHKNFRLTHDLKEIQGVFVATDVNTDFVTVNGTYMRAAVDTITTESFTRISDHVLNVTVTDLVGPKGSRRDLSKKMSGTITGTFHADIVFDGERGYAEKTVDKDVNIVIGEGEAEISVGGKKYWSNVRTGQIK